MSNKSIVLVHDCSKCKLKRRDFNVNVDPTDIKVYHQLQTRMDNALQAATPSALDAITETVKISREEKKAYFKKAFENVDEVKSLYNEWWTLMRKKYGITDSSKVSYEDSCFFECVDENGVPDLTGDFIPKDEN